MTSCPHFGPQIASYEDIVHVLQYQSRHRCHKCPVGGPNLWLCLDTACLFIGCGDEGKDHSGQHHLETDHHLLMNITSKKIWCEVCQRDVTSSCPAFVARALSLSRSTRYRQTSTASSHVSPCDDSDDDGDEDSCQRPRGLTGLMNIGNTCYMNAALQSLSNCVPLTNFFTECPGYVALSKNPSLSKNYMKLMKEIWHKKRLSYVTPSAIFNSIKLVHPMFRGYLQHDSQEFLRCFMDQLHEELKQPILEMEADDEPADFADNNDNSDSEHSSVAEEQTAAFVHRRLPAVQSKRPLYCDAIEMSDTDYETCDSGLSSENSSENAMELASRTAGSSTTEVSDRTLVMSPSKTSLSSSVELTGMSDNKTETDDGNSMCISTSLESGITTADVCNAIGDGFGDCVYTSRSKTLQFDTGSGELGDITVAPLMTSNSVLNPSIPSIDSAISDDGSISISSSMQFDSNISRDDSNIALQKPDSARTASTVSSKSKRSTPRLRESSESFEWTGKVRRASEGSTLQPPAKPKRPVQYTSIISAIFDGKILSSVQCLTCLRISSTNETFQDLSLPIPGREQLQFIRASSATPLGPVDCDGSLLQTSMAQRGPCAESASRLHWVSSLISWPFNAAYHMFSWFWGPVITLQDCLAAFFSADELKGDNMYSCEKCKKLRNGVKYSKVLKLPEILCVHLKRFRHEFTFSSKINSYVSFPLEGLDMRPYLHKDCKDEVTSYDLVAVICHHGTAGGGHYTAYGLNYINLSWYEYDDQSVTEVDAQQVETCEAYVLFYRKKNEPIEVIRANAQQLSKCPENGLMTFYVSRLWISKFNSFAEPGPINNYEFLCRHGDIRPSAVQASSIEDLVFPLPQNLWEYLHGRFGGGPAVNRIAICQHCQLEAERLLKRQKMEKDEFVKLNAAMQDTTSSRCALYGLSNVWFREWENFVLGKTNDPPGPIDNSKICQVKNGVISLLAKSDHVQLTDSMWAMMHNIYGGGPEVLIRPAAPELSSGRASVRSDDEIDSQASAVGQFDPPSDK